MKNSVLFIPTLFCCIGLSSPLKELPKPVISYISNMYEFHYGFTGGQNSSLDTGSSDTVYVIPRNLTQATIVCNASYPITWNFHNQHLLGHRFWLLSVHTTRAAKDIYDISTYEYLAVLNLYGDDNKLTGNYSCQHTTRDKYLSSVFVYWQTMNEPIFLRTNESLTVYLENGIAVLPCGTSEPVDSSQVYLQKFDDKAKTFKRISYLDRSINFDSKVGIVLRNLPSPLGKYQCVREITHEKKELVTVEVQIRNATALQPSPDASRNTKAKLEYTLNAKSQPIARCCSNSTRAPRISHTYCNHPITCAFRREFLDPDPELRRWLSARGSRSSKDGCTTARLYIHSGGTIRCIGDGIDQTKQVVFGIINYRSYQNYKDMAKMVPVYFDWTEIDPHQMMALDRYTRYDYYRPINGSALDDRIYGGQSLQVTCNTSPYYFSGGTRWAIRWKNNTIQLLGQNPAIRGFSNYIYGNANTKIVAHVDMLSLLCIAPVWNSTEYIHKSMPLYVNQSTIPLLTGPAVESFTWTLNETVKEIKCEASGVPLPSFDWKKDGDWKWNREHANLNHSNVVNSTTNRTAFDSIQIHRVTFTTNGTYYCVATNYAGKVTKTIHIFVKVPPSWKTIMAVVAGLIVVIILVLAIAFMGWRLRRGRTEIQQLSSMSYTNGVVRDPVVLDSEPTSTSTALDTSKLSVNLID